MSDFLSNILAGSLAPALEIAPRPRSRFEQAEPMGAPELPFAAEPMAETSTDGQLVYQGVESAHQPQQGSTPEPLSKHQFLPTEQPQHPENAQAMPSAPIQVLVRHEPFASIEPVGKAHTAPAFLTHTVEQNIVERRNNQASMPPQLEPAPKRMRQNAVLPQIASVVQTQPSGVPLPVRLVGAPVALPPALTTAVPTSDQPVATAVRPTGARAMPNLPFLETPTARELAAVRGVIDQQPQQAAPTIHVTIGRIEVRATTATVPQRQRGAAAPLMGLDEYLRQRNGGRNE